MQADWEHWYLRAFGIADIYTVSLIGPGTPPDAYTSGPGQSWPLQLLGGIEYRLKKKKKKYSFS